MKHLMIVLLVMTVGLFSNEMHAQKTCTPEQIAACKKICSENPVCTPEQIAACKKTCSPSGSTAAITSAVKVVNTNSKSTTEKNAEKSCVSHKAQAVNVSPFKLVGLETKSTDTKEKKSCMKPCEKAKGGE